MNREELLMKLEEIRDKIQSRQEPVLTDGDSPVWVIDQFLKRAFNPSIFQMVESQEYDYIGTIVVYDEISDERFYQLRDIYKADNPNYNLDGFVEWLQEDREIDCIKQSEREVLW